MSKALTLTIVIPVYNEESYIHDCLEAISKQVIMPNEVIVVDNNSTDNTVTIAKKYDFVTVVNETRQGVRFANEMGMDLAKSDIIARIDADTILPTGWSKLVLDTFVDDDVPAISGPTGYYNFIYPETSKLLATNLMWFGSKIGYKFLFGCNMAIRKSVWNQIKGSLCDEKSIFEDVDLAFHMLKIGYQPRFVKEMSVLVSSRRADDRPVEFYRYIKGHTRTARHHSKRNLVPAMYAETMFMIAYLSIKPLHMVYDPVTRRFDPRRLYSISKSRPNPMDY